MMNRWAAVMVGLLLGCGPGPDPAAPVATPAAKTPAAPSADSTAESGAPAEPTMTYAQAKQRSDALWTAAETQKTNVAAWEEAAAALAATAKLAEGGGADPRDLLRGALAAWRNAEQAGSENNSEVKMKKGKREPIPPRDVLRLDVLQQLHNLLAPEDKDLAMIGYRRGRIYWNFGHFDEAVAPFAKVVERYPASQEAKFASSLLLDSLLQAQDFSGLEAQAAAMLKNTVLISTHSDLRNTLDRILHQAAVKRAQAMAKAEDFAGCGDAYMALFKRVGKAADFRPDHLLHNASVCFEKAGNTKRAIGVLRKLARTFPSSELAGPAKERAKALAAQ